MDSVKDNNWNPCDHIHMDNLENLTHEVNTHGS